MAKKAKEVKEPKPQISKRGRKSAPHTTAKSEVGFERQVGYVVDARFHNTFKEVCAERGIGFSEVIRGLQEHWLKKQLDKKASC